MAGKKLERVAEGVYRRPSGKYVVPLYDARTGKRKWAHPDVPRGGFDNLKDAKAFKARMETEKQTRATRMETCDQFARRWTRDFGHQWSDTTRTHNRERVKTFAHDFKDVPLGDVSRPMARLWVNGGTVPPALERAAKGWKGAKVVDGQLTVPNHRSHLNAVRAMWNAAIEDELVHRNPFASLGLPQGRGRADVVMLNEGELDLLVDTAEQVWGEFGQEVFGPMVAVAAYTGMRPGELYALRWSCVDFEAEEIAVKWQYISRTKREELPGRQTRRQRVVPLLPPARAALGKVPKLDGSDHVFHIPRGGQFSQRQLHYYWNPVRRAFWVQLSPERQRDIDPGFDFYELRHRFGSYLASLDVSPYDIADAMGHGDGGQLAMRLYIHTDSAEARDRIKRKVRDAQAPGRRRAV